MNKLIARVCKALFEPFYESLKLEKLGYNEIFGEYCVGWFSNEILEKRGLNRNNILKRGSK